MNDPDITITIFRLENCPNCEKLKEKLDAYNIPYITEDMQSKNALCELRYRSCFAIQAPVLLITHDSDVRADAIYQISDLFDSLGNINEYTIKSLLDLCGIACQT